MSYELETDTHHPVGPLDNIYGHAPVTALGPSDDAVFVCLDCGYTSSVIQQFMHEDCSREDNGINQTWREYLDDSDYPS